METIKICRMDIVKKRKRITILISAAIILICFCFAALYSGLTVRKYTVKTDKLDGALRIVLITDLHSVYYGKGQNKLIAGIDRQRPDIVLLAGDIADDGNPHDGTIDLLKGIAGKYPCYYVSGNHEFWSGEIDNIKEMFRSCGVRVLEGENETVEINGQDVNICGIDDPEIGEEAFAAQIGGALKTADNGKYTILLAHRPERIEQYLEYGCDLILSGHTHGGQWRIPLILNGLVAPDQGFFPKYGGGRYELGDTVMIVSRGLQKNILPRVFNPPELVVIDILPE